MPGTSNWRIRPLAEKDVPRVGRVLGLARLHQGDGFYLVAWKDNDPVGHAHLALTDPPELQDVSVRPDHRRRGVATALTRAAEREARRRGHACLRLTVSDDNAEAQALYRRLGYQDAGFPPQRVQGTIQLRTGPLEVDDTLLTWEKSLRPPALLLHGGPGMSDYTGPLARELEPLLDVTRYRQGKHAEVAAYVDEALSYVAEPTWLVGHSWGGYLALQVAATSPGCVEGLVLVGSVGGVGDGGRAAARAELRGRLTAPPTGFVDLWPAYFAGPPAPYPDLELDEEQYAATNRSMDVHAARGTLERALPSLAQPVLLVHGAYDHIPLAAVEATAARLPNAELRVLDGVGHFPWLERPGSVAEAIVDWGGLRSS